MRPVVVLVDLVLLTSERAPQLALTAATPIMKGRLLDRDTRWEVLSAMCDDRTPIERGEGEVCARAYASSLACWPHTACVETFGVAIQTTRG